MLLCISYNFFANTDEVIEGNERVTILEQFKSLDNQPAAGWQLRRSLDLTTKPQPPECWGSCRSWQKESILRRRNGLLTRNERLFGRCRIEDGLWSWLRSLEGRFCVFRHREVGEVTAGNEPRKQNAPKVRIKATRSIPFGPDGVELFERVAVFERFVNCVFRHLFET